MTLEALSALDIERRSGGECSTRGGVVREYSRDRSQCIIVYSHLRR